MMVDGVVQSIEKSYAINGDNSSLDYYFDENGDPHGFSYSTDDLIIRQSYVSEDGTPWYSAYIYPGSGNYYIHGSGVFGMMGPDERNSARMRFIELAIDALVGNLKNNVTMSSGDGVRVVRGTLTEDQVPELVKAGIDMLIEQSSGYYFNRRDVSFDGREYVYENVRIERGMKTVTTWKQMVRRMTLDEEQALEAGTVYEVFGNNFSGFRNIDGIDYINDGYEELVGEYTTPATRSDYEGRDPLNMPMSNLTVDYVHGEAEIDPDGNLLSIDLNGAATLTDIFGDTLVVEIKANASFSDIGTSEPVCPVPGAEQLLTREYLKTHFGSENVNVFFKQNQDGSIDADSVTTTHPGERDIQSYYMDGSIIKMDPVPAPFQSVVVEIAADDIEA